MGVPLSFWKAVGAVVVGSLIVLVLEIVAVTSYFVFIGLW